MRFFSRIVLLQDEKIKSICRHDNASSAIEIARRHCVRCKCFQKDCDDKYLSLGPILYEIKSASPIRILAHDFLSQHEIYILESHLKPRLTFELAKPLLTETTVVSSRQVAKSPTIYITELFYEDSKVYVVSIWLPLLLILIMPMKH